MWDPLRLLAIADLAPASPGQTVVDSPETRQAGRPGSTRSRSGSRRRGCVAIRACGIDQWDDVYPIREVLAADVRAGTLHLALLEGRIAGALVLKDQQEPEHAAVPWTFAATRVAVVHRLMGHPDVRSRGVARGLMTRAESDARARSFEGDPIGRLHWQPARAEALRRARLPEERLRHFPERPVRLLREAPPRVERSWRAHERVGRSRSCGGRRFRFRGSVRGLWPPSPCAARSCGSPRASAARRRRAAVRATVGASCRGVRTWPELRRTAHRRSPPERTGRACGTWGPAIDRPPLVGPCRRRTSGR
ncbi:MAG: GNAT family N-acetyltransferase [Myxococcaceae bacterium]|nr:GNAT family N-acetyltransferase [Myxococcaceae bacterium]